MSIDLTRGHDLDHQTGRCRNCGMTATSIYINGGTCSPRLFCELCGIVAPKIIDCTNKDCPCLKRGGKE